MTFAWKHILNLFWEHPIYFSQHVFSSVSVDRIRISGPSPQPEYMSKSEVSLIPSPVLECRQTHTAPDSELESDLINISSDILDCSSCWEFKPGGDTSPSFKTAGLLLIPLASNFFVASQQGTHWSLWWGELEGKFICRIWLSLRFGQCRACRSLYHSLWKGNHPIDMLQNRHNPRICNKVAKNSVWVLHLDEDGGESIMLCAVFNYKTAGWSLGPQILRWFISVQFSFLLTVLLMPVVQHSTQLEWVEPWPVEKCPTKRTLFAQCITST